MQSELLQKRDPYFYSAPEPKTWITPEPTRSNFSEEDVALIKVVDVNIVIVQALR